nr:pyrimidine/purine nucleoside phosphorylase [Deefgea sp. CFH1-16]
MSQFDQVSVLKQGNVYFDGKCVSHTILFADGSKKTIGVIQPSALTFNTAAAEIMEVIAGVCSVKQANESTTTTYSAGHHLAFLLTQALILKPSKHCITFVILPN